MIYVNSETILKIDLLFSPYIERSYPQSGWFTFNNYLIDEMVNCRMRRSQSGMPWKSVRPDAVRIMRTTRAERGCLQATSTLRASAHQRLFYSIGNEISYWIKKRLKPCSSGFETVINVRYYRGTTQIDVTSTLVILCVCMHHYARRADNGSGYPPTPTWFGPASKVHSAKAPIPHSHHPRLSEIFTDAYYSFSQVWGFLLAIRYRKTFLLSTHF